tara:strand:+ start:11510 stop:12190 length:681 start_codon:yes stop_codon:yes gene_type:complete
MTFTKNLFLIAAASLAFTACGDDDDTGAATDAAATFDATVVDEADAAVENPPMPALGVQIDRVGRPAIATALMATFEGDDTVKGAAKDAYNEISDPTLWAAQATAQFRGSLAILDSLDTNCGNQFGADLDVTTRYNGLAGVFADDQLYVNSGAGACPQYLGVEIEALGVVKDGGCGGRTPTADIIETSYSALAIGALTGVDDTITEDGDCAHSLTAFPFICAPLAD